MKVIPIGNDYALAQRLKNVKASTETVSTVTETKPEKHDQAEATWNPQEGNGQSPEVAQTATEQRSQEKKTGKRKKERKEED